MATNAPYAVPTDLYYDRSTHVWARPDGPAVTIGLDALGLESLGDLAYISLPGAGAPVRRGEPLGSLEAAKMVGDLIAPISGILTARNEAVLRDPGLVNRDPYGAGWIAQIAPADWTGEAADLAHGAEVEAWAQAEIERYRAQGWIE